MGRGDGDDGDDGFVVEPGFVCPLRRKTNGIVLIVSRHERQKRRGEGVREWSHTRAEDVHGRKDARRDTRLCPAFSASSCPSRAVLPANCLPISPTESSPWEGGIRGFSSPY